MGRNLGELEFDYMWEDEVISHVKRNKDGSYEITDYNKDPVILPFRGKDSSQATDEELLKFFKYRCMSEHRRDLRDALDTIGLQEYDPYNIVRKTYGLMFGDCMWVRFKGVTKNYDEVRRELGLL